VRLRWSAKNLLAAEYAIEEAFRLPNGIAIPKKGKGVTVLSGNALEVRKGVEVPEPFRDRISVSFSRA
jgi:hypothetical protein